MKKKENYLDYIFEKNPAFEWKENAEGMVCIIVEWKGFYNRIAQKFFHKPKKSEIAMDVLGSFVWKNIDGKRNVYELGELVKAEFGEKAEPLYERLIKFLEIMKNNKYILLSKKGGYSNL